MMEFHHAAPPHRTARLTFASGRVRRGWIALLLTTISTLSGCYRFVPVTGVPSQGTTLVLDLNDRGRLALGDSIGASAARIEGLMSASSPENYVLQVSSVQYLNGQSNRWSGEQITVRTEHVGRARQREFSRSRTFLAGLGVAAVIVAAVLAADLGGSGSFEPDPPTPPPGSGQ